MTNAYHTSPPPEYVPSPRRGQRDVEQLSGSIERITYYNPENGYSVLRVRPDRQRTPGLNREGLVTVVGVLPELSPGEFVRLKGYWENHPQHGLQFSAEMCEQTLPATVEGIRLYLGSGLIKGIGPHLAERIVAKFGEQTFDVIENQSEHLLQVRDIGEKRVRIIRTAWEEQKQVKEIVLFLHAYGVSTNLAIKIYKEYGNESLEVVQTDPYRLARDITGIGFKTADRIAQALGLPADHPSRLEAGVIYTLNEMSNNGHVYSPQDTLLDRAAELLEVPADDVQPAVDRLTDTDRVRVDSLAAQNGDHVVREETAVYLTPFYHGEMNVAAKLRQLAQAKPTRLTSLASLIASNPAAFVGPELSAQQQEAVNIALGHPVSVLTGGPGTGKTTTLKALIAILEMAHKRYALASPTGRAAKRLSEATGQPASTIHRLLDFSPGTGFQFNAENPLPIDLLVIDEVSMLDILLANHLLKALQIGTHLLLVGDSDQLPSVGPGDVLRDIINSQIAPVTRLNQIFRQASGSQIITNAHRINQGFQPVFQKTDTDFFLFPASTPEETADWVVQVVAERIPKKFGFHPREHIQVLAPMYRGPVGVDALNSRLQATLNPAGANRPEKALFGQVYRIGDKVMQTQNNYDKEVFNGDIGVVAALSLEDHTLTVDFEGHQVLYEWTEGDQLTLAYAISVHKAQGSEFPVVVLPMVTQHYLMLQRNLLYTAVTRARKLCVLVGDKRAIQIAVRNNKVAQRYTALDRRLQPE
ncbi:MAG TPA: ATP-dependent RecD-like DNA helicase [Anaerolineaceae bacterium]|nr:ATP-dependent RecD-like DNA helicase [Anaerolineaceae bacterium]